MRCRRWWRPIRGCYGTDKSRRRIDHAGETAPIAVQIAGADPLADGRGRALQRRRAARRSSTSTWAARRRRCATPRPARRCSPTSRWSRASSTRSFARSTCRSRSRSAPARIRARAMPLTIARIAEDAGVQALTVHGRTRACAFVGAVEYDTIAAVKRAVAIPVIANGDIATPEGRRGRARAHGRRRGHDRPRGAGTAVDLSRDRALPRDRRAPAAADRRGSPRR